MDDAINWHMVEILIKSIEIVQVAFCHWVAKGSRLAASASWLNEWILSNQNTPESSGDSGSLGEVRKIPLTDSSCRLRTKNVKNTTWMQHILSLAPIYRKLML